ncbi:MAG TPA: hypothetical protein VGD67_00325 [Pseudonocardiaceae bacterium]
MPDRGQNHRDETPDSVSVSELLAASKRSRDGSEQQIRVERPREQEPSPRTPMLVPDEPRTGRTLPRVLGVAAAMAVLAGSLVATQMFMNGEQVTTTQVAAGPEHIRGAKVFRPDLIRASLNTDSAAEPADGPSDALTDGAPGAPAGEPGSADRSGNRGNTSDSTLDAEGAPEVQQPAEQPAPNQPPAQEPTARPAPTSTPSSGSGTGGSGTGTSGTGGSGGLLGPVLDPLKPVTDPILGPILGFYAAAPEEPTQAFALLDPSVQDGTIDEFAQSWEDVSGTEVRGAVKDGDNAFVVHVSIIRLDGTTMLTKQRIVVGDGPSPKIVDAELLSVSLR